MAYNNYLKKENIDSDGESRSRSASNGMETSIRKNYRNTQQVAETPTHMASDIDVESNNMPSRIRRWILRRVSSRGKNKVISLVMLSVIVLGSYGVYEKFFNLSDEERAQKELAAAIAAVGQLMILPEGDEPVLATVTDTEALVKQQAFFAGAINGDQLLLFPRNLKAILYSPSRNKIINAGPIEQQPAVAAPQNNAEQTQNNAESQRSSASSPQESATVSGALTVEVRNGTDAMGYAAKFAEELGANTGYTVVKVADAGKKDYQNTVVYVRTNDESKQSKVDALTTSLGVAATDRLPEGEKSTSADVLVILGGN